MSNRNPMPAISPTTAGITLRSPSPTFISILGIRSDHTEAATITPEANPINAFCSLSGIFSFMKNTKPLPIIVPISGSSSPIIIPSISVLILCRKHTADEFASYQHHDI